MNAPSERHLIPAQSGIAVPLRKGDRLTVIDPRGGQVADLYAIAAGDPREAFSSGRTIDYNETIRITTGAKLWSNRSSPMFEIVDDTVGLHDVLLTPCSERMFQILRGARTHPSCHANIHAALSRHGVGADAIGATFNVFMNVDVTPDGRITIGAPHSRAGDRIVLRAEMDLVAAVTACSSEYSNGGTCKPVEIEVMRVS